MSRGWIPPKVWVAVGFAAGALIADRWTKSWIERSLSPGEVLPVFEGVAHLTHVRNPGAAFGLFADADPTARAVLFGGAAALAISLVLFQLLSLGPGERRVAAALGLVAGGALGNLADRLPGLGLGSGEVVDFLHVDLWPGYDWPDFNLADVAIVLGVAGLLVDVLTRESALRAQAIDEERRE